MHRKSLPLTFFFASLLLLLTRPCFGQQKYSLVVPSDPSIKSVAEINGDTLTITRPSGQSFKYKRSPAFDTAAYWSFFSASTMQYVRFPKTGIGKMQIGRASGGRLSFTESKMEVSRIGSTPSGKPAKGLGAISGKGSGAVTGLSPGKVRLAHTTVGGKSYLAFVDGKGRLRMYRENAKGKWENQKLGWKKSLVPNASVGLVAPKTTGQLPSIVSIDSKGKLLQIANGATQVPLSVGSLSPSLVSGSAVTVSPDGQYCFACDDKGVIWQYGMQLGKFTNVEARPNLIEPGGAVSASNNDVFVIGKAGNLVGYSRAGSGWSKPYLVGAGFESGGTVASWQGGGLVGNQRAVASVNKKGNPQVFIWENKQWKPETITDVTLAAGAPIGIGNRSGTLVLSFVDKKGNWLTYRRSSSGLVSGWSPTTVSTGIPTSSPLLFGTDAVRAFSVNGKGQLIAARFGGTRWNVLPFGGSLLGSGLVGGGLGSRVLTREVIPNPPLPPVEVVMKNNHREPIVMRVFDRRGKKKKYDVKLKPFQSTKIIVERDSGGRAKETFSAVGPLGTVVRERVVDVPPKVLYDVVIYENSVTSQFFDRTKPKSKFKKQPDSESRSLRSVGVFEIDPGTETGDGTEYSAYGMARSMKNPGAAAKFGPIKQ